MTPAEYYSKKRAAYREETGADWRHRTDQVSEDRPLEASEVAETVMRSGIECRALKANGWDEIMMVVNAILIRDRLAASKTRAHA